MMATKALGDARVALCHEWFTALGGSDLCAARIAELLDVDTIFTFAYRETLVRKLLGGREVHVAHRMGASRAATDHWQWFLPLMPHAWRAVDLSPFDVVVTSSHACTNAIRVPAETTHISYCYTPMRYAWDPRREMTRLPALGRALWPAAAAVLRRADRRWAQRVDGYIAISETVSARIERFYGRESRVVYPPVDTSFFTPSSGPRESYLVAGRLVGYKRFDVAVDAFTQLGYPLVVAGSGPELHRLRERAGPTIRFEVQPSLERLRELYRSARALVFPGIEDFGMVPVEAQACGTPVIAQDLGGATETIVDGITGVLYHGGSPAALIEGIKSFENLTLDRSAIRSNIERFGVDAFDAGFLNAVRAITGGDSSS